jgi:hypothetical protein
LEAAFEGLYEYQPFDFATKSNSTISAETDDVEDFLADVDADRGQRRYGGIHGLLLWVHCVAREVPRMSSFLPPSLRTCVGLHR